MQTPPKTGDSRENRFTVEAAHAIQFAAEESTAVLSTPWLIWHLEHSALDLLQPLLEAGEITVGVYIELEHLAAAPVGAQVTCRSRVVHAEGPVVTFQIEARDQLEVLARGLHKRRVVKLERVRQRIQQKIENLPNS